MLELNKVILIGNLTRDPEISYLASGMALAKWTLAVNRRWKDAGGEQKEEVSFIDCQAWAKTAEFVDKFFIKGQRMFIEARLKQDRWEDKDGQKRSRIVLDVERVQFAEPKRADGEPQGDEPEREQPTARTVAPRREESETQFADDLPF